MSEPSNERLCEAQNPNLNTLTCKYCGRSWYFDAGRPICSEPVLQLKRELAEARRDSARLDWMAHKGSIEIECTIEDEYSIGHQIDSETYPSLREAIDAAMQTEGAKDAAD